MALSIVRNQSEQIGATNELIVGAAVLAAGMVFYFISPGSRRKARTE
jgi:hypothetical protein